MTTQEEYEIAKRELAKREEKLLIAQSRKDKAIINYNSEKKKYDLERYEVENLRRQVIQSHPYDPIPIAKALNKA